MSDTTEQDDAAAVLTIKVVTLGAARTGKTTILNRLVDRKDEAAGGEYTPTIGVDFYSKHYSLDGSGGKKVKCQIWDTAGQERFQSLLDSYIKSTSVVVLVYSIDDSSSFERAKKLYKACKELKDGADKTVYYLVANKADLIMQRQVLRVDGEAFAAQSAANMTYVEICGNEAKEVKEFFERLVQDYWAASKLHHHHQHDGGRLSSRSFTRLNRERLDAKFLSSTSQNTDTSRSLNLDNRTSAMMNSSTYTSRCAAHHKIDVNSNSELISARKSTNDAEAASSRLIQEFANRLRTVDLKTLQTDTELQSQRESSKSLERKVVSCFKAQLERKDEPETVFYKNEVNELNIKLSSRTAETERAQREVDMLRLEKEALERTIGDERKIIEELKSKNTSLEEKLAKSTGESSTCEKEKLELKKTISELESSARICRSEKEDLKSQYHKLNEQVTLILNKYSANFGVIQSLETLSVKIDELLSQRSQASLEVSLAESSVKSIQLELKKKDETISLLAANLQKQEQAVRELTASYESLKSEKKVVEQVFVEKIVEVRSSQSSTPPHDSAELHVLQESNKKKQETIDRLVVNLNDHEKKLATLTQTLEDLKLQRDAAIQSQVTLRTEMVTLNERFSKCKDEWLSNTLELDSRYGQLSCRDRSIRQMELDMELYKSNVEKFKVEVSQLLSDSVVKVGSDETQIKESIKMLMNSSKERAQIIALLQVEIEKLNDVLGEKSNQLRHLEHHYGEFKARCQELETKFGSSEGNVQGLTKIRDEMESQHRCFESFVERACKVLKLKLPVDEYDMLSELFLSELFAKIERDHFVVLDYEQEKKTNAKYNRLEDLKAQLSNKDVHLDLLRKKVVDLEEAMSSRSDSRRDFDSKAHCQKKLLIKIQKQAEDIEVLKCENLHLKSHVFDTKILSEKIAEYESELKKRQSRIGELESINDKYLVKLDHVKSELEATLMEFKRLKEINETTIHCLNKQLGDMKVALESVRFNEGKLANFRECVAKLLGVSSQFNCADHEMIARIEQIIRAVSVSVIPVQVKTVTTTIQTPRVVTTCSGQATLPPC